jgi:hypothetical protein
VLTRDEFDTTEVVVVVDEPEVVDTSNGDVPVVLVLLDHALFCQFAICVSKRLPIAVVIDELGEIIISAFSSSSISGDNTNKFLVESRSKLCGSRYGAAAEHEYCCAATSCIPLRYDG